MEPATVPKRQKTNIDMVISGKPNNINIKVFTTKYIMINTALTLIKANNVKLSYNKNMKVYLSQYNHLILNINSILLKAIKTI